MAPPPGTFHSKFGGLWIDQTDRDAVARGFGAIADPELRQRVIDFERDGFVIIRRAVPPEVIDRYRAEFAAAAAEKPARMTMTVRRVPGRVPYDPVRAMQPGSKILSTAMLLPTGHELSFAPPALAFLEVLFGGPALAFQSLHFEVGSTQPMHQDTTYTIINEEPMQMVASWIALEDVERGTGELIFHPGGHRIPEFTYGGGDSKFFSPQRDAQDMHMAHRLHLTEEPARMGLKRRAFLGRKGDMLFWHADMPHAGGAIRQPGATRRALTTHYCPLPWTPRYFGALTDANRVKVAMPSGGHMASWHYAPSQFGAVPPPPAEAPVEAAPPVEAAAT